jgi:glycosyltransferase involved in cell wall biosynthesis
LLSVLPNGVNRQQFFPDHEARLTIRDELGLGDAPVLLYVGRVCEQKGTDTLLSAYKHLLVQLPDARLVIAGPIEQFSYSDGTAPRDAEWRRRMDLEGAIYLGRVHEKRLLGVYNMADVFVMPTRELEMFGMAAIEAQACGVPVLASDHGGLRETVPDECGGRFPVGDAGALAAAARALLSDPTARAAKARAAVANAARYGWGTVASTLDDFYELAVASNSQRCDRSTWRST